MIRSLAALALAALVSFAPALAQEEQEALDFGGDAFRAGGTVDFAEADRRDAFLMGERVDLDAAIAGSAHLAGRRVESTAAVGGNLYAMGQDVRVAGPVAGAATLAGRDVAVTGDVGGNLRATGSRIDLAGAVGGAALIAGDEVRIASVIVGDASVTAETLTFAEGARVDGRLTLHEVEGAPVTVPGSVAPPDRIDREVAETSTMMRRMAGPGWFALAAGVVFGALALAALATLAATVAPEGMSRMRAIVAEAPFRTLGMGFLAQAALVGAAILLALTIVGLILAPFAVLAAVLLGLVGYVVAVYLVGAWAITRAGALEPDTFAEFALAGLVGAAIVCVLTLAPFLGWFVMLALTFLGVGAIAVAALRPGPA